MAAAPELLCAPRALTRETLGYQPQVPFTAGLAETVRWYRENRAWWEPLKARAHLG